MEHSAENLNLSLRLATEADVPALHELIETSVRGLQIHDYTPEQINGALGTVLGLDTQLVADGTYFVAEAKAACARVIAGRGVWTKILEACEGAARAAGFARFEMGATLTGVPLYLARGYQEVERIEVPLQNGEKLPVVRMAKNVAG